MNSNQTEKVDVKVLKQLDAFSSPENDLIDELIHDYESDSTKLLNLLTMQLSSNDSVGIQESAHGLKSISGCLGMVVVSDICQKLEDAVQIEATTAADIKTLSKEIAAALILVKNYQFTKA